jgi:hypothetical protein
MSKARHLGPLSQDPELFRRAMGAYFRSPWDPDLGMPNNPGSYLMEIDDRRYVVLANSGTICAVFRIRQSGLLKRLRRWPSEIEEGKL